MKSWQIGNIGINQSFEFDFKVHSKLATRIEYFGIGISFQDYHTHTLSLYIYIYGLTLSYILYKSK